MEQPPGEAQGPKQASSAQELEQPSSKQDQEPATPKQSANLVGVPLGVPDGTEVIDWTAAVDQVLLLFSFTMNAITHRNRVSK